MELICSLEFLCSYGSLNALGWSAVYLVIGIALIPFFGAIDAAILHASDEYDEVRPSYLTYVFLWPVCLVGRVLNVLIRAID